MEISLFLARAFGLYLTILGLAFFFSSNSLKEITKDYFESKPLIYLGGIMALLIGCLMIAGHNVWELNWRMIITLIGWLSLFKGIFLIMWSQNAKNFYLNLLNKMNFKIAGPIYFAIGLFFCWIGFFT